MGKKGFLIAFLVLLLAGGLIFGGIALFVFKPSEKDTAIDPTAPIADPNIPDGTLMRLAETAAFYDGTYVHRYDYGYNKVFGIDVSSVEVNFKEGDNVRITGTAMDGFVGVVQSINLDEKTVDVLVSIFGRETPATLPITQVVLAED